MTNIFNYIDRPSPIHRLTGATKLVCLLLWSFAAMATYDTRLLVFLALLSLLLFILLLLALVSAAVEYEIKRTALAGLLFLRTARDYRFYDLFFRYLSKSTCPRDHGAFADVPVLSFFRQRRIGIVPGKLTHNNIRLIFRHYFQKRFDHVLAKSIVRV